MYRGFPDTLLDGVACPDDGGALEPAASGGTSGHLRSGSVRCARCHRTFPVADGIIRLLADEDLEGESRHEQRIRDTKAGAETIVPTPDLITTDPEHAMEILPTLEALAAQPTLRCLEVGCGRGRYTEELARTCGEVVAVDFSMTSLRRLAERLPDGARVGLVQADVTALRPAARRYDRVLNTLHSNLPDREHRDALQRFAAASLADDGRYVFSTHNYGWRERRAGLSQAGRYEAGGMFRYLFTRQEILEETAPWFGDARIRPIVIILPFARRLRLPLLPLSRLLERVPGAGPHGGLWLITATRPHRDGV